MTRGIVNRIVGGMLLAFYIILVGGCGAGSQPPLTMASTGRVTGQVLDARTKLPLAEAKVRIASIVVQVEKAGVFGAIVPTGRQQCDITADGYQTYSAGVTIVPGENDLGAIYLLELPPPPAF
jgi:hypothetical protein